MIRRPPSTTRTAPPFPYTTSFRSADPEQFRRERYIAFALRHRAADRDAVGGLARAAQVEPGLFAFFAAACHIEVLAHHQLAVGHDNGRSEEHTSELQSLMRISYAGFCLQKKNNKNNNKNNRK